MIKHRQEAQEVYRLLLDYMEIHKKVFKSSLKELGAALGLSTPVPYSLHRDRLDAIRVDLRRIIKKVSRDSDISATTLVEYAEALTEAVSAIHDIVSRLADVAAGAGVFYGRKEYKEAVKAYNERVKKYTALGYKLNEFFPNITGKM
ncbi:MAG: hypothetical protein ACE5EI_06415 [Thermodesulfobacteriota bacterium]